MNFHQRIIKIPIIGCADENICTDSTIAQICVGPDRIQRSMTDVRKACVSESQQMIVDSGRILTYTFQSDSLSLYQ